MVGKTVWFDDLYQKNQCGSRPTAPMRMERFSLGVLVVLDALLKPPLEMPALQEMMYWSRTFYHDPAHA